ncbi:MAG: Mu transposase C-terminal domain-containing protein [Acidobacteriota bacterium]
MVLGMTAQRVIFHYGVELVGLKYNSPELAELRRRVGDGVKVELTFDPGDLSQVNVLNPQKGSYLTVPAVNQNYTKGLSLWQHRVIRRFAQRQMDSHTDLLALAQAKADIRALVERDFNRKSTRGRKRYARFMEDHSKSWWDEGVSGISPDRQPNAACSPAPSDMKPEPDASSIAVSVTSDDILPVFESGLDLPRLPPAATIRAADGSERNGIQ